ncbi:MAG TPA: ROK family protein [Candidatus Brocadiia bacterium]|nr:ROK family protein [Candidatus Brocadiia bacterium]
MRDSRKLQNMLRIARCVRDSDYPSRADLAAHLELGPPAITALVGELIKRGVVMEDGSAESKGGRRPTRLALAPEYACAIGAELSQSHVRAAKIDFRGRVVGRNTHPNPRRGDAGAMLDALREVVKPLISDAGRTLVGIGVGVSGIVDRASGVVASFPGIASWRDVSLARELGSRTGCHVQIENLVRAATLGELRYGNGRSFRNFVYVHMGMGLGLGMVFGGRIHEGAAFQAGEFGHMVIIEDGPVCYCGNFGCLESVASIWAMVRQAHDAMDKGVRSRLEELRNETDFEKTVSIIFSAAKEGDRLAVNIVQRTFRHLGMAIANVVNLLNPEAVILGGALAVQDGAAQDELAGQIRAHVLPGVQPSVRILPAGLGHDAYCLGAAALEFDNLMSDGRTLLSKRLS